MKYHTAFTVILLTVLVPAVACQAEIKAVTGHNAGESASSDFTFKSAPQPCRNDAATKASLM